MAYMKPIAYACAKQPCKNRAMYEVFNRRNASHGKLCGPHATALVRELEKIEKEEQRGTTKSTTVDR